MSAFIVSRDHIDVLVTAALAWELTVAEDADQVGRSLWDANLASVAYRYPRDVSGTRPGAGDTDEDIAAYTFTPVPGVVDPVIVHNAAVCLGYQSCEVPAWGDCYAEKMTVDLMDVAGKLTPRFNRQHGQMSAGDLQRLGVRSWEVDSRDVFLEAARARTAASSTAVAVSA